MSERGYYLVFVGLIALTLLTSGLCFLELGDTWHAVLGVTIAVAKAALVALFFMHLWHGTRLNWLALSAGVFWLFILVALTLTDYQTRSWLAE